MLTHDGDFGAIAMVSGASCVGIVYLRPGHIDPQFTIQTLERILQDSPDLLSPFLLVALRSGREITIRVRRLGA